MPSITFSSSLLDLESFGTIAAEDEPILDFFLTTEAVSQIMSNRILVVLGRKGSGKTALVRFFAEMNGPIGSKSLSLKGYPWNVHASRIDRGVSESEAYVSSWRYFISLELVSLTLSHVADKRHPEVQSTIKFLKQNYHSLSPDIGEVLRPQKLTFKGTSIEPQVLGCKLGSLYFERQDDDAGLGPELNSLSDILINSAIRMAQLAKLPALFLHFDELDRGLTTLDDPKAQLPLIGLILAAREVRHLASKGPLPINPVIYLRSDIWDDLKFPDKNKISETVALNLEWDSESLLNLINRRLKVKLSPAASWDVITNPGLMRGSQTKWNHILSRTFLRPRDVIKFLNVALIQAKKRPERPLKLENKDIINARTKYSTYLKNELDDEISLHWHEWEDALHAFSAISTMTFSRDKFVQEYNKRHSHQNAMSVDDALKMLYRFSVIGYKRRSGHGGSSWAFHYTTPEAGWDNGASYFKVHLGLKEVIKLREERLVGSEKIHRENGYLYYLGKDGYVWAAPMKSNPGGKKKKVGSERISKETGYLYFIDKAGFVAKAKKKNA